MGGFAIELVWGGFGLFELGHIVWNDGGIFRISNSISELSITSFSLHIAYHITGNSTLLGQVLERDCLSFFSLIANFYLSLILPVHTSLFSKFRLLPVKKENFQNFKEIEEILLFVTVSC